MICVNTFKLCYNINTNQGDKMKRRIESYGGRSRYDINWEYILAVLNLILLSICLVISSAFLIAMITI